jgi:hypothetical protein
MAQSPLIEVCDPCDVFDAIKRFAKRKIRAQVTMLDPWYNKGIGGVRDDYVPYITCMLEKVAKFSDHIYLWGFPEIIAHFVTKVPESHVLTAWLTWYYKNNPSVIRGWRSAQMACLHLSTRGAKLYPEHFLNEKQLKLREQGKLRYMPGPTSVIEGPLLVGFVGRKEQTGHKAQKPMSVYDPLIRMTTVEGDLVFDPMCGSGTTGAVCQALGRRAIISDIEPAYTEMAKARLLKEEEPPKEKAKGKTKKAKLNGKASGKTKSERGRRKDRSVEPLLL